MILEIVAIAAVALVAVAMLLLVLRSQQAFLTLHAKEVGRILAQADESRKAAWSSAEAAHSRLMAACFPMQLQVQRTSSGVIEGAQQKITPHFANDGVAEPEPALDATTGLSLLEMRNGVAEAKPRDVSGPGEYEAEEPE